MWDSSSLLERGEKTHAADDALRLARRRDWSGVDSTETVADEDLPAVAGDAGTVAEGLHEYAVGMRREDDTESATRWNGKRKTNPFDVSRVTEKETVS